MTRDDIRNAAILFVVMTASLTAAFAIDRWLYPDVWIEIEPIPDNGMQEPAGVWL